MPSNSTVSFDKVYDCIILFRLHAGTIKGMVFIKYTASVYRNDIKEDGRIYGSGVPWRARLEEGASLAIMEPYIYRCSMNS